MTDKSEEKKPSAKVKAQKGAWWNSTSPETEKNQAPSGEKKNTPRKSTRGRRPRAGKEKVDTAAKPQSVEKIQKTHVASQAQVKEKPVEQAKSAEPMTDSDRTQRPKRSRSSRSQRGRRQNYRGRNRRPQGQMRSKTPDSEKKSVEPNLSVQLLRKPSVRRGLARQAVILHRNMQQIRPKPVRASFTDGLSYGKLLDLRRSLFSTLTVIEHQKRGQKTVPAEVPQVAVVKEVLPVKIEAQEQIKIENQIELQDEIDDIDVELQETDDDLKIVSKLLINAEEPEECRLALLENGRLESLTVQTVNSAQTKNNIYKARIVAVEPNLQAAFVDYGTDKNGFLPFSEIHQEYYKQNLSKEIRHLVDTHQWKKLSITDVVEKGQEVLVQVVKEEVGKKGANMTTYLSLPGRCVVLMPGSDSTGVSRKISGETKRNELKDFMKSLNIPDGIGWIVRTASSDITENALTRDVDYLLRLWDDTRKKAQGIDDVGMVYQDHDAVLRFLREHFDPSIEEILVDDLVALEQVKGFIELLPAAQQNVRVRLHKGSRPIFNQFSVEDQIESIYQPKVNLPSGGSIVIDPTEALVAIDVNSGSTSKSKNFEATIFQANMEAAAELARQLRLRDLGGLIVVDFIDMRNNKHIREVERQVKQAMKRDKAKVDFSRISKFGLMQISRQKLGAPIAAGNYRVCEHCKGRGVVKSVESLALFYLRRIQTGASRNNVKQVECHFPLDVAGYLLNNKRNEIHELETKYNTEIIIIAESGFKPAQHDIILNKMEKQPN